MAHHLGGGQWWEKVCVLSLPACVVSQKYQVGHYVEEEDAGPNGSLVFLTQLAFSSYIPWHM